MVLITRSMTDLRFLVHLVLLYETAEAKARSFDTGASSEPSLAQFQLNCYAFRHLGCTPRKDAKSKHQFLNLFEV